jgi:hypothetical protein
MAKRKYRNVLNQPLPLQLASKSLSVPGKGYFTLEECDWNSGALLKLIKKEIVQLIEEQMTVVIPEDMPEKIKEIVKEVAREEEELKTDAKSDDEVMTSVGDENKEPIDDSLTSTGEVVELESDKVADSGEDVKEDSEPETRVKRNRRKKKASRE